VPIVCPAGAQGELHLWCTDGAGFLRMRNAGHYGATTSSGRTTSTPPHLFRAPLPRVRERGENNHHHRSVAPDLRPTEQWVSRFALLQISRGGKSGYASKLQLKHVQSSRDAC
jgi:hypothetical protein